MTYALKPLEPPYSAEVEQLLAGYPRRGGYLLTLFRTFANSARFLRKGVVNLLDNDSPLPLRLREIVILRVTARLGCVYEWGVHVAAFAAQAGLSEAQVAATRLGGDGEPCWSAEEALTIRVVDELCNRASLSEATRSAFQETWTQAQQLEILALCGNYHTVSFVANVAQLEPEPFGARFPAV